MKEAAALAGLNVLQLINDYTAIAINYGIFRRKVSGFSIPGYGSLLGTGSLPEMSLGL